MLVQTIVLAVCATLAAAAPSLESRANSGNAFHYGIAGPVTACPGVSLPANGLYAAVQTGNGAAVFCGETISITDSLTGNSIDGVLVTGSFPNCDSIACAPKALQVPTLVFTTLGTSDSFLDFPVVWSFDS